ncbi:MAG: 3-deoxy-manno-octulosonate cytidylyltransferase [Parachlamydiaceae bacterium]|nr:3-deoxy-manno-octulosonate cytidylyltransferase [Parachlamydiaceae bacterium]
MVKDHHSPVVAIIPARYGSTRFPGKILASIYGKSLIQRTYENAKRCTLLSDILIATDDDRIYDHVISFGGKAVMTPTNCATGSDRIAFVVDQSPELQKASVIVNIQGDEPCIDPSVTTSIIKILQNDPNAVMSTAVVAIKSEEEAADPGNVKCILDLHGNVLYFSRALLPGSFCKTFRSNNTYYKHVGVYAYRPQFLLTYRNLPMTPLQQAEDLEQLKVLEHGYKIKAAVVNSASVGVNTPEDIKKVEQELCKQNSFS